MFCRRGPAERGANMLEYVGITIVVAGVIVALAMTTVPSDIQAGFANGVCRIVNPNDPDCKDGGATASPAPGDSGDPTAPTGAPSTEPTGGSTTDPGQGDPSSEYDDAKKAAEDARKAESDAEKEWGNLDEELLGLVADLVGWTSAKDCFTKGDIGACLETLLTAIPWGKLFKAAKMVPKIWKLFRRWQKLRDKLTKARKARKKADDALEKAKKGAGKACSTKPKNSFTPDTRVLLANGRSKPIAEVRAGDRVLVTDPATGVTRAEPVITPIAGYGTKRLVDVTVDVDGRRGGAMSTVTATTEHPFYNPVTKAWTAAADLVRGSSLRTADGSTRTVTGLWGRTEVRRVYNLNVAGASTYYVLAGLTPLLVHNEDDEPCDAAWQGALHIQDEIARGNGNHSIPGVDMNDTDAVAKYLDDVMKGAGTKLKDGGTAWYDRSRGYMVIKKNEYSGTGRKMTPDEWERWVASRAD